MLEFKWIDWNLDKIAKHELSVGQVEHAARRPGRGFPRRIDNDKYQVWSQTPEGVWVQVLYVVESDGRAFVIHARPLSDGEKRQLRRRRR